MVDKCDKLKTVILQLIGENNFLLAVLDTIKQRGDVLPTIILSCFIGDRYIPATKTIELGIPDILDCFKRSFDYSHPLGYKFKILPCYLERGAFLNKCKGIIVYKSSSEVSDVIKELDNSKLLDDINKQSIHDVIAIYSLAYSLYHEIGHTLHDKYIPDSEPIKREIAADTFAFEAIKSMCNIEDIEILLLGAFIGVTHVFSKMSYQQEKDDEKHPYTIERLYNLFDFWKLDDNSHFWHLTYTIVKKWCVQNELSMEWDIDNSCSDKEKFVKAYLLFRRPQQ